MARGIALPIRVGPHGGVVLEEGDAQAEKVIATALGDCDSSHAFQLEDGLGTGHIFQLPGPARKAVILARLFRIFATFEKLILFRIDRTTLRWGRGEQGELVLTFNYVDLETSQVAAFSKTFAKGSS